MQENRTARQIAEEAAATASDDTIRLLQLGAANRASDVWEPFARELYEMLRGSTPGPLTDDMPVTSLLRRARQMLGVLTPGGYYYDDDIEEQRADNLDFFGDADLRSAAAAVVAQIG